MSEVLHFDNQSISHFLITDIFFLLDDRQRRNQPHKTAVCDKCGRQKKSCDTGCRNMIILPQVSKSGQAILNHETESLRKLLKVLKSHICELNIVQN